MYLSRLILNPRNRSAQRDLANCQSMHQTVMSAFPPLDGQAARAQLGVLFRVDHEAGTGRTVVLVQSKTEPDWSRLPEGYTLGAPVGKSVGMQYGQIREGRILRFRLLGNPTRKIDTKSGPNGEKRNGHRVELFREADQLAWLERKALDAGFQPVEVQIVGKGSALEAKGRHPAGDLVLKGVVFEGRLQVRDQARFIETLERGVGPGKAYGFGLLSIAP